MSSRTLEDAEPALAGTPEATSSGLVTRFDRAIAGAAGRNRGRRSFDLAALVLSNLADYGLIWVLIAAFKARRPGPRRRRAVVALGLSGFASMGVSAAIKSVAQRQRPGEATDPSDPTSSTRYVRAPSSSSFPSGHTLAAFCTANVVAESASERAALVTFAGAVGASRVHLGAHHASDILGGAVIGSTLGSLIRRVVERTG